jgi:hypothetical protein
MNINIAGLHILSSDALAKIKGVVEDEGHTFTAAASSGIAALWEEVKAKYPTIVAQIEAGIKDAEDSSLSGGEKAVKVAMDILPYLPQAVSELADVKSFAVHAVTTEFARLKNAAAGVIADIAAKL